MQLNVFLSPKMDFVIRQTVLRKMFLERNFSIFTIVDNSYYLLSTQAKTRLKMCQIGTNDSFMTLRMYDCVGIAAQNELFFINIATKDAEIEFYISDNVSEGFIIIIGLKRC